MAEAADLEVVLADLEACVGKDAATKVEALRALTAAIDPADESYEVQAAAGAVLLPSVMMQLLEDDDAEVAREAATALAALSDHSGAVRDRLEAGHFAATPEKVRLNPVQEEAGDLDGLFGVLVNMRFSDDEATAAAGTGALAALTSLNRGNALKVVHEIVKRLVAGEARALEALDDAVVGIDIRDDAAVLLDQAIGPALAFLRSGPPPAQTAAAALLATIAEGRRGAAAYLVAEGALPLAAGLLVDGDLAARDSAVQLVWTLVKDNRKLLSPAKDALGVAGAKLVAPLMEIIDKSEAEAAAEEGDGDGDAGGGDGDAAVDNGDSALLLLRALAGQDDAAAAALKGEGGLLSARSCAVM